MADGDEEPLVQESAAEIVYGADSLIRSAFFLLPRADASRPPSLPSQPRDPGTGLAAELRAEFKGWAGSPGLWRQWIAKLRPRHQRLWRELGILGAILATTYRVRRDEALLLQLAAFWSGPTNTFVFPWGEATFTLEDVAALAGLPLVGCPVRAALPYELEREVSALESVRAMLSRSPKKKPSYGAWVEHFLERAPEDPSEARELTEHGAFLSMWLSLFVFSAPPYNVVRREVFPLAVRLASGQSVGLAPAALASIYNDLSKLKCHPTLEKGKESQPFGVSAPMHILQLWVWEHFPELRPDMAPDSRDRDAPRAARWHDVSKQLHPKYVRAVFLSPKDFRWRPYGSSTFALPSKTIGHDQDMSGSKALLSFARCLHACDLVGMNSIEKYHPHRVARQLGFDQDVPATVTCVIPKWKKAWDTYDIKVENSAFLFPNHHTGVTAEYVKWWDPYSMACASAVANAAKLKGRHISVIPIKRKMEGLPATNSGKKLHADTTTRKPHPVSNEAEDLQDHIPLLERLNSIIKRMHKGTTEGLVRNAVQERTTEIPKCFTPRISNVGAPKASLNSNAEQALSLISESSFGPVKTKAQGKYLQQSKQEGSVSVSGEKNRISEHDDALLDNAVQLAVSTGATFEVDVIPTLGDFLVISDDDESVEANRKECEVNKIHPESFMFDETEDVIFEEQTMNENLVGKMRINSPKVETAGSILHETDEGKQSTSERNDVQDNPISKDSMLHSNRDCELASVLNDISLRQEPDILSHVANVQTRVGNLKMQTQQCFVAGERDNTDKVRKEDTVESSIVQKEGSVGSNIVQKEDSVESSRKRSGNNENERSSSRLVDGTTEFDNTVVCTKTLYYLRASDLVRKSASKDANSTDVDRNVYLPKRAVGTMEMIKKASAIRKAEIAELMKEIHILKEEILVLEAAERQKTLLKNGG